MLQPKRTKYRKMQKGRVTGIAFRGSTIDFGSFAIKSLENAWITARQIEAARIEGATFFQMMRYVLLPGIRPTIILMMIMTVIWSFLVFDFVYILTQGGPAFSSEVLSTMAYRKAFYDLNVGQAAATSLVISLFGLVATYFYIRVQSQEGEQ